MFAIKKYLNQASLHFPLIKRFSTIDDKCKEITNIMIKKLEEANCFPPLTLLTTNGEVLKNYLEKKIKLALINPSNDSLKIRISKKAVGINITKPCTLVVEPKVMTKESK